MPNYQFCLLTRNPLPPLDEIVSAADDEQAWTLAEMRLLLRSDFRGGVVA